MLTDDDCGEDTVPLYLPITQNVAMSMISCLIIVNVIGWICCVCQCKRAGPKAFVYGNVESDDYDSEQQKLQQK